jgi:DNA repair exonuclease SbcCD ATPase subunit
VKADLGAAVEDLRASLRRELQRREEDEARLAGIRSQRQARAHTLLDLAPRCGIEEREVETLVVQLEHWLDATQRRVDVLSRLAHRHAELAHQQGNASLDDLESEIEARHASLRTLGDLPAGETVHDTLEQLEAKLDAVKRTLANLQGQRQQLQESLPEVAEAEERYAAAEAELARVQRLDSVLAAAQRFMGDAQERVHRDIAPVLAEAIRGRIEPITNGRYSDVLVDPASLEVRVRDSDGEWREAALLSHGTAEQVYLLLRVALAEHLTRPGETCPLILDDVTAHCDDERTRAVLDTLYAISRERQVILFSQEPQVREWAEANLREPHDRLRLLATAQDQLGFR